jgi:hypothetical protein
MGASTANDEDEVSVEVAWSIRGIECSLVDDWLSHFAAKIVSMVLIERFSLEAQFADDYEFDGQPDRDGVEALTGVLRRADLYARRAWDAQLAGDWESAAVMARGSLEHSVTAQYLIGLRDEYSRLMGTSIHERVAVAVVHGNEPVGRHRDVLLTKREQLPGFSEMTSRLEYGDELDRLYSQLSQVVHPYANGSADHDPSSGNFRFEPDVWPDDFVARVVLQVLLLSATSTAEMLHRAPVVRTLEAGARQLRVVARLMRLTDEAAQGVQEGRNARRNDLDKATRGTYDYKIRVQRREGPLRNAARTCG